MLEVLYSRVHTNDKDKLPDKSECLLLFRPSGEFTIDSSRRNNTVSLVNFSTLLKSFRRPMTYYNFQINLN